jgi:hypothetical protein
MLESLNDYDWKNAFAEAGSPIVVKFANPVPTESFIREDVVEIIATADGENDGPNWLGVFLLKDGRYAMVDAGCDYTGWDCQAWGTAEVCGTLDEMIRWGLSNEQRKRLNLELKEASPDAQ